jgi:hypothetical protein
MYVCLLVVGFADITPAQGLSKPAAPNNKPAVAVKYGSNPAVGKPSRTMASSCITNFIAPASRFFSCMEMAPVSPASGRKSITFGVEYGEKSFSLFRSQPVAHTHAALLHALNPSDSCRKIGTQKTTVCRLVCKPADCREAQVNRGRRIVGLF